VTVLKAEKLTTFTSTSRYWGGGAHCVLRRTSSTFWRQRTSHRRCCHKFQPIWIIAHHQKFQRDYGIYCIFKTSLL